MKVRSLLVALVLLALGAGVVLAATGGGDDGRIGPESGIQPSGRKLHPVGKTTELGNLPTGGALTNDGRFLWTLSAGRGANDIRIVRVRPSVGQCKQPPAGRSCRRKKKKAVGKVVQKIKMPGLSGGMAMDPTRHVAYVSGTPATTHSDGAVPDSVPGREGDVIHTFTYNPHSGKAKRGDLIAVPPPDGTLPPQSFPPTNTDPLSWPRDLSVSPDGSKLIAALNLANSAAIVDLKSGKVSYTAVGRYPYGAAITSDGKTGLISNETDGTVTAIQMSSGDVRGTVTVGPHLSHPESIAVDPRKPLAYVAVNSQDLIAVVDTDSLEVVRTLSVERPQGIGTSPVHVSVTADGCRLLSSDAGEDAIAVFALRTAASCDPGSHSQKAARLADRADRILRHEGKVGVEQANSARAEAAEVLGEEAEQDADAALARNPVERKSKRWQLLGRIPTASYPAAAFTTPQRPRFRQLVWIAAKGLGVGRNDAQGRVLEEDPGSATSGAPARFRFDYLPSITDGMSGVLRYPSESKIKKLTPRAARQLKPANAQKPPAGTPLTADGPIDHVFYVVRENRSYDQILGDDPRGDGDPKLTLFGNDITPNAHALVKRFPLLDHVYANSEASIDGHFWTSAGAVSDYVTKSWHANYGGRQRPYDFGVYSVTWPSQRFLFDQAEKQGISYYNYGEAVAGTLPLNDLDRTPAETAQVAAKFANTDVGPLNPGPQLPPPSPCYSNDASIGSNVITGQDTFDSSLPPGVNPATSESRFDCFKQRFEQQLAGSGVPAFNYLVLPSDHTEGTSPGRRTPNAMIADNDYALGQIVDEISHSPIWDSSLILVIEDDSQDGADHVDAHRIPALAISPYTKRGAVVHDRYDFLSFIRTLELVTGMKSMNLFDATAVPLYDAFDSDPSDNSQPYTAIVPTQDRNERNPTTGPDAKFSSELPLTLTDRVPQQLLDRILWHYVHGSGSQPPPPGPNSSGLDLEKWRHSEAADLAEGIAEVRQELLAPYEAKYGRRAIGEAPAAVDADDAHADDADG
jgi:DNA-binding beta-propeller fold protein YncE